MAANASDALLYCVILFGIDCPNQVKLFPVTLLSYRFTVYFVINAQPRYQNHLLEHSLLKIEKYYYHLTKQRMRQNYENIQDKEFVDWFLVFNFDKAKRKGLIKYYRKNFLSILKRKIHTKSIK